MPKTVRSKKAPALKLVTPQLADGQKAFEKHKAELDALHVDELEPVRVDLQSVAALSHSVAMRDKASDRSQEFERLGRVDLYDVGTIDRLASIALAAWFVRQRQIGKTAVASSAQVPESVLRDGQERRGRMYRVLSHWFGDDDEVATELTVIRSGSGYQDLANDLDALGDLYQREEIRKLIAQDVKHYRADDVAGARRNSKAIFKGLGIAEDNEAQVWTEMASRAWTLLSRTYAEHQRCGVFLFGRSENVAESYPSLVAAVRSPARRAQSDAASETPAGLTTTVDPGATD